MTDIKSRLVDGMRGQGIRLPDDEWLRLTDEHLGWIAERLLRTPGIAIVPAEDLQLVLKNAGYHGVAGSYSDWDRARDRVTAAAAAVQAQEQQ